MLHLDWSTCSLADVCFRLVGRTCGQNGGTFSSPKWSWKTPTLKRRHSSCHCHEAFFGENFSRLQILSKNIGFFKEEDSEAPPQNQPNQLKADEIIPWVFSSWSGFQTPRNCKKKTQENRQKHPSGKRSAYDHLMPAKISGRCNWIPTTQTQPLVLIFLLSSYFIWDRRKSGRFSHLNKYPNSAYTTSINWRNILV